MIRMSKIVETNASNWKEEVLESEELVVVEFWHPQCPFCKMLEPAYIELSKEYVGKLKFARINVLKTQESQELAAEYGIMSTPTLKFFCGGRPIQDIVGALSRDYLRQGIEFAIKKHRDCAKKSTPLRLPYIS
jgi:thioredoxin 1